MSTITSLKPASVWQIFDAITRVPRPSKHEEKIRDFLVGFARSHALECRVDEAGNVLILKSATPGMENRETVVLQSHIDMVCEKNSDVAHDFSVDPIKTRIEDGWVKAEGTTLGADCGIGMAAELAILIDEKAVHPAIEALFTVDEETGLTGAFNLGADMLSGKYLINLDSEDEGEIFIGCAGGIDTVATFTFKPETPPEGYDWIELLVSGLKGGHSGDNIPDGLGNSNKIMARLMLAAADRFGLRLAHFDGGNLRNAIPREAMAVAGIPSAHYAEFVALYEEFCKAVADELQYTDSGFRMDLFETKRPATVVDADTARRLLLSIEGVSNGVLAMSFAMKGLVETSTNLASVKFRPENRIEVVSSQRSSVESSKWNAARTVDSVFELAGAEVAHGDGYPGWAPNPNSRLLEISVESYQRLFGKKPVVRAIHAGLECGLFLEKYPHLEMVSFGPTLRGVHSPDERLEIDTVQKFWDLLVEILRCI
ncbi:MAG: aminoacyl-histidine dipeptidase [Tidjanibacter sp.]|nr:aminoacyl-histidine dipeptidase [Tidjanibacter sp.]